jgi:hypothetical protein
MTLVARSVFSTDDKLSRAVNRRRRAVCPLVLAVPGLTTKYATHACKPASKKIREVS